MLTALLAAALFQSAPVYTVEVFVQDKQGLFGTKTVKVSREIPLENGSFEIYAGGDSMLEGDISISGDIVDVEMVVCRPRTSPCDVIGEPSITFQMGASASIREREYRTIYEVTFEPE